MLFLTPCEKLGVPGVCNARRSRRHSPPRRLLRDMGLKSHRQRPRIWPSISFETLLRKRHGTEDLEKYRLLEHMRTTRRCCPEESPARTQAEWRSNDRPKANRFVNSFCWRSISLPLILPALEISAPGGTEIHKLPSRIAPSGNEPIRKSERPANSPLLR